jgi:hypothetical protein
LNFPDEFEEGLLQLGRDLLDESLQQIDQTWFQWILVEAQELQILVEEVVQITQFDRTGLDHAEEVVEELAAVIHVGKAILFWKHILIF